jgi:hypothetical protein
MFPSVEFDIGHFATSDTGGVFTPHGSYIAKLQWFSFVELKVCSVFSSIFWTITEHTFRNIRLQSQRSLSFFLVESS